MLLSLLTLAALTPALDVSYIAECGILVQGTNCVLFQAETGVSYEIEDTGAFAVGDRVHVVGTWASSATCEPGVDAIIYDDSILEANCPVEQFCGCHHAGPCGNTGAGQDLNTWNGCGNSAHPEGASISINLGGFNIGSVSADNTDIAIRRLVPHEPFILFVGSRRVPRRALGDGLICIGSGGFGLARYPVVQASGGGTVSMHSFMSRSIASLPARVPFQPGSTLYFQGWYRDPASPCGSGSNTTAALKLTLLP